MISESWELTVLNQTVRRKDESEEAWQARQAKAIADINSHSLVLFHALIQVPPPFSAWQHKFWQQRLALHAHDCEPAQPETVSCQSDVKSLWTEISAQHMLIMAQLARRCTHGTSLCDICRRPWRQAFWGLQTGSRGLWASWALRRRPLTATCSSLRSPSRPRSPRARKCSLRA